ncbi:MAG TPA: hypothetical protein PLI93_00320 [Gemmatimonadales bacterium]|nr:hypothetical protein [Gemmatimonadales bacterium]HRX18471.1 hypothetical protein [Gemmatimonadales bacterium]
MRRLPLLLLLGLAGCTWSNALYRARQLAGSAERAERQDRGFEAANIWGQVAVRAESAHARSPEGRKGAEALWLQGRALARLGDCPSAIPVLQQATIQAGDADWRDRLRLDLARCQVQGGDPLGALEALAPLRSSADESVREEARILGGRALVLSRQWEAALEDLAADETVAGQWQRAIATANLGREAEVLDLVAPRFEAADTSVTWEEVLRPLASHGVAAVDSLLRALEAMPVTDDTLRGRWRFAVAQGLAPDQPARADSVLREILTLRRNLPVAGQARVLLADHRLAATTDRGSLADAMTAVTTLSEGDATSAFVLGRLLRAGEGILTDIDAYPASAPLGDLAFFHQAQVARDTLLSPALAGWLLGEIEQRWPASPYVPKAMLARIPLQPDSAEAIRTRLRGYPESPYLRYLAGREGPAFAALEDSLARYLAGRAALTAEQGQPDVDARDDFE